MEIGYIIGRFNHITNGHKELIDIGLRLTDKLLVIVGSANREGTLRNPFNVDLRIKFISEVYKDEIESGKLILTPLADMSNEEDVPADGAWGRYVLNHCRKVLNQTPTISVYGYEETRKSWYDPEDLKNIKELIYLRHADSISATKIREYLYNGDKEKWLENTPCEIHHHYEELRKIILKINGGN